MKRADKVKKRLKTWRDYHYSFPQNVEIANQLLSGDQILLAKVTGFSYGYVMQVLRGKRKNDLLIEAAKARIEQNQIMRRFNRHTHAA